MSGSIPASTPPFRARRWRVPPPITRAGELLEGAEVLTEVSGETAVLLWKSLRTVTLWASASPQDQAMELFAPYDVILDGTDNFPTRYLVNDACVLEGKPCVYGSILRWEGQASVFWAGHGPCYRCLFREPPPPGLVPTCAEGGVLGILPGMIGIVQATNFGAEPNSLVNEVIIGLPGTLPVMNRQETPRSRMSGASMPDSAAFTSSRVGASPNGSAAMIIPWSRDR